MLNRSGVYSSHTLIYFSLMIPGNTDPSLTPFACTYPPQIAELLYKLKCTIAFSTYQAGKLIFLSPKDSNSIVQLPRNFHKPMGIALHPEKDKLALATRDEVLVFSNSPELAKTYPKSPGKYDALYLPRATYYTSPLDLHDLHYGKDNRLFAVNTLFSCVMEIGDDYHFVPYWTPPFIQKLESIDACHMNGMILENGLPKYVSAFGQGNTPQSWRQTLLDSGLMMDVQTNEVIADQLAMPHSPMLIDGDIYILLSATGELVKINRENGQKEVLANFQAFVRGMGYYKGYLFIGISKLRKSSETFGKLSFADQDQEAGIVIYHLANRAYVGKISYQNSVDEIYDLKILADKLRPNILNTDDPIHKMSLHLPGVTFWGKKEE